jgi:BirA family transcriptional regulator, biotin operon repressor / biotin---[acetyl-CoA-carboxylase] ligase
VPEHSGQPAASGTTSPSAPPSELTAALGLARLDYHVRVTSTMDVAHAIAADGAPAGTLVLASSQEQGRGRSGKHWLSAPDAGLWCTLIERPRDARALDVLALRVGLQLADALDALVDRSLEGAVQLKWPNDLWLASGKLGGILIEARWRDGQPEWVAIGVGINRLPVDDRHAQAMALQGALVRAAHVRLDVSRDALLMAVVPALRRAAACTGPLSAEECAAWASRDRMVGRVVRSPSPGVVEGITADGGVVIRGPDGVARSLHSGSLEEADAQDALPG